MFDKSTSGWERQIPRREVGFTRKESERATRAAARRISQQAEFDRLKELGGSADVRRQVRG